MVDDLPISTRKAVTPSFCKLEFFKGLVVLVASLLAQASLASKTFADAQIFKEVSTSVLTQKGQGKVHIWIFIQDLRFFYKTV